MKRFAIGDGLTCDLDRLVDTRLLVQANSGGGKSWLLRRLLELTHGQVQHLVIDPEGEFASLRERFDYVLAAKSGGDTAADPRSAKLLAERLLELKVSAILDIYELQAHERVRFVRLFLNALIDAPKALWHPALVVVDEAHVYCPQTGEAESAGAVKDLATRGRKRGFCAVLATQRLSKLHKDAAAECNNKLIGRTSLDVDMKRAADELGLIGREDIARLRALDPGAFFAFGPAFSNTSVTRVAVGAVVTSHPKAGARLAFTAPPPTSAVKALLPKLADLPAEAAERERSIADLQRELANTRRELTLARREHPAPRVDTKVVEKFVLKDGQIERLEKLFERVGELQMKFQPMMQAVYAPITKQCADILARLDEARTRNTHATMTPRVGRQGPVSPPRGRAVPAVTASRPIPWVSPGGALPIGERKILTAAAQYPDEGASREQLTILTGYKRSSRDAYIQRLVGRGFVTTNGNGNIHATEDGVEALGSDFEPLPTGSKLLTWWLDRLPIGEKAILEAAVRAYPEWVERDQVSDATGYKRSSRDAYIQRLTSRRVVSTERGAIRARDELFD
jgi:hypothetical protein